MKFFKSDNGGEYISTEFQQNVKQNGIKHDYLPIPFIVSASNKNLLNFSFVQTNFKDKFQREFKIESDGYLAPDSNTSKYIDQKRVFRDLGLNILSNAWDGYNARLYLMKINETMNELSTIPRNKTLVSEICSKYPLIQMA